MQTTNPPMQLSQRVRSLKPSATFAVNTRVRQLRAQGRDIIGFGAGEPDFETPPEIKQAAIDALLSGQTHYMPVAGEPTAREAIAEKLRVENGIACSADHVVITVGAKHAFYLAMQCLIDPGQGQQVILPTPAWVSYRPIIELAGGEVVEVPGPMETEFKITPDQLSRAITDRTAAVLINSPSNPCGTMYSPDELRALAEVLKRHDQITIITDEIYEKLIYGGIEHFSLGSIEAIADRVVTINGLSKAYAMTGWRIGYACAPGNDGVLANAMAKLQGQMTSNITSFCYAAVVESLRNGAAAVEQMRAVFSERAELIHELLGRWPQVKCPKPTGAFYVFPDISAHFGKRSAAGSVIDSSVAFAEALLEEANVAVVPGEDFGACARGHVRLSFAASPQQISEGCQRIDTWLRQLR
ncbi:MAG: pyridoxal phosphate-dependent aminotransferase [Planctomycetota bacterium]|nr:pyridoxal phosphate-dependent aminotransferase [Planctomycetota bacterium]